MEKLELILDARATLGEGPCWDSKKKVLYWVDVVEQKVHIFDPKTGKDESINVGQQVGAVVPRKSGGLILALRNGFYALDLVTKELTAIVDPEADLPGNRFNDGKCDAAGRFWAGTMEDAEENVTGSLYRLDSDLSVTRVLDGVAISNGIAWEKDNQTMYFIDSPTKQVVAFDFDLETGRLDNKRTVVTIPDGEGIPDGMTIDSQGMLWVAQWGGYQVSRWNPNTGERIGAIKLPVGQVTSCVFGGEKLDELYITTASRGLDEDQLKEQPYAGGLFRVKTGVTGTITYEFAEVCNEQGQSV